MSNTNPESAPKQAAIETWTSTGRKEATCDFCASTVKHGDGFIVPGPTYMIGS